MYDLVYLVLPDNNRIDVNQRYKKCPFCMRASIRYWRPPLPGVTNISWCLIQHELRRVSNIVIKANGKFISTNRDSTSEGMRCPVYNQSTPLWWPHAANELWRWSEIPGVVRFEPFPDGILSRITTNLAT